MEPVYDHVSCLNFQSSTVGADDTPWRRPRPAVRRRAYPMRRAKIRSHSVLPVTETKTWTRYAAVGERNMRLDHDISVQPMVRASGQTRAGRSTQTARVAAAVRRMETRIQMEATRPRKRSTSPSSKSSDLLAPERCSRSYRSQSKPVLVRVRVRRRTLRACRNLCFSACWSACCLASVTAHTLPCCARRYDIQHAPVHRSHPRLTRHPGYRTGGETRLRSLSSNMRAQDVCARYDDRPAVDRVTRLLQRVFTGGRSALRGGGPSIHARPQVIGRYACAQVSRSLRCQASPRGARSEGEDGRRARMNNSRQNVKFYHVIMYSCHVSSSVIY